MALFGFLSRKAGPLDPKVAEQVYELAVAYVRDSDNRIHVEDLVSALAAATGEACLRQVGQVNIDDPASIPGSRVLSDAVNGALCADQTDWEKAPPETIYGIIHHYALVGGYAASAFPPMGEVFRTFIEGLAGETEWGWVPLSTPPANRPIVRPLQAAHDLRGPLEAIWTEHRVPPAYRAGVCALALAKALAVVKEAIDPKIAVRTALETVNAMAKTVPVNETHMRRMKADAASGS